MPRQPAPPRPVPDDYAEWSGKETVAQLVKRYKASCHVVARWNRETGRLPMKAGIMPAECPADFEAVALTMSQRALALHYGASTCRIREWERALKIKRKQPSEITAERNASRIFTPTRAVDRAPKSALPMIFRDDSIVGQAARFLQRLAPISRCNDEGRASQGGKFWRRGSAILTDAEVIERAKGKGWSAAL